MNLLYDLLYFAKFRIPTVEGNTYTIKNPWVLFKKTGKIKLTDGQIFYFNEKNKKNVLDLVLFILSTGIHFGRGKYQWKFNNKREYIETHQGVRFKLHGIGILDETFLKQVHFAGFNLEGKVVITGGAYIGDTPLFYASYGAKVIAFEPDPISFKIAMENISLNPRFKKLITLVPYAIGKDVIVKFPLEKDSGGSSIFKINTQKTISVRSMSISSILKEFNINNPYLLDLDIKGAEFEVIKDESVAKFKKVRIEYSPYLLKNTKNISLSFLLQKLQEYQFNKIRIYKHNDLRFDLLNHGTIEAEK